MGEPIKILLIEDDEDDYIIVRGFLDSIRRTPFKLAWVSCYEEGREAMSRNAHDVYLVDYRLGPESGLDLLREAEGLGCSAPIILLTGLGDSEIDLAAMSAGAADYLVKGQISAPLLERSINHALQRKRIERKLRDSEEQYRLLFDQNPHPMWVADAATLAIEAVNAAAVRHYGYSPEEFLGMNFRQLQADEKRTAPMGDPLAGLAGQWRHQRKTGPPIHVEITFNWISMQGRRAVLIAANDITHRLTLEAQLRQSQKMESLGTLAGGIAHDFNNVLSIILGYASSLPYLVSETQKFNGALEVIRQAGQRATGLVKQILTFARRTEVAMERVNPNALVRELGGMLSETFPKAIRFSFSLYDGVPPITADPSQLHQALLNLCVNARDAMPEGGTLSIDTGVIAGRDLRASFPEAEDVSYLQIGVADTGIGMDEATRSHVFEPFFTTKGRDRGSGLGLAVVYGVVKSHEGFIKVDSALGLGTTFRIFLPAPEAPPVASAGVRASSIETPSGTETIMVVEDEAPLRMLLQTILGAKGYTVLAEPDGQSALETFERRHAAIDLVIADIDMPRLRGHDAIARMKKIDPNLRFMLASGYVEPGLKTRLRDLGAEDFIQKPYECQEILRRIRTVLDDPRSDKAGKIARASEQA